MADVPLTVQQIDADGMAPAYGAVTTTDTYKVPNDGRVALHAKKTGAGACTVTLDTPGTAAGGLAVAQRTITVPATTGDVMMGPYAPADYNDSSGRLSVTFSEVTGLTVAAIRI